MTASCVLFRRTTLSLPRLARTAASAYSSSTTTATTTTTSFSKESNPAPWRDPAARQYMFWNREAAEAAGNPAAYEYLLEISPESMQRAAHIISLSDPRDAANDMLHKGRLPVGARLMAIGTTADDFDAATMPKPPNVLFVSPSCPHAATVLPAVLRKFPTIQWVHCRSAGIDFVESAELVQICNTSNNNNNSTDGDGLRVTNAKGQFSSSLAEYVMLACGYFAKDLPRLVRQQGRKQWQPYNVHELRGKTLGIIGYGTYVLCGRCVCVPRVARVALTQHFLTTLSRLFLVLHTYLC